MLPDEERARNRDVVRRYLACKGEEQRRARYELFAADGQAGLWTSDKPHPIATHGREGLREHGVWSLRCFPDWEWYDVQIFDTQHPTFFWAECDGRGAIRFEGYPDGHYENHFLHSFEFNADGLITRQREFMNPLRQYEALGIAVPQIVRTGIPT
ncbi:ketosteroid isomerase-like protein [Kitasatospora sp. SolWspMP-SS2h]|uniref:PhzA/PhzB family protein n=1 Tax=Kitasatospora sp. SolWspMP-SS2h TaxID=1305729 RepID=UPI000DBAA94C|nr:PhzA/PhzB family protein [Kitasatospora sp. SolWspMP-SS2h]RAJ43066.1 ketosteroid isomerase-like protein [Kitasatospora sp. SolWspMP-SS2h]